LNSFSSESHTLQF